MQPKVLLTPFYIIAATFIGLGTLFFLAYYQHLGITPTCAIGGCEIVLNSVYSKFLGLPLSYFGLVFMYTCLRSHYCLPTIHLERGHALRLWRTLPWACLCR